MNTRSSQTKKPNPTSNSLKKEIDAKIAEFEEKAKHLSTTGEKRNVSIITFTDKNDDETPKSSDVKVVYVLDPHLLVKVRCMDLIISGKRFEAGLILFDTCVTPLVQHSHPEIQTNDKLKLGVIGRLGAMIELEIPDLKKN